MEMDLLVTAKSAGKVLLIMGNGYFVGAEIALNQGRPVA